MSTHPDVERLLPERYPRQVLDLAGLGGREEHGLALLGKALDDLLHLVLEPLGQDSVGLVDHQALEVLKDKALGVLQVLEQQLEKEAEEEAALESEIEKEVAMSKQLKELKLANRRLTEANASLALENRKLQEALTKLGHGPSIILTDNSLEVGEGASRVVAMTLDESDDARTRRGSLNA